MHKVNLVTLGCPKNTVDSERMHRLLELNGYGLTHAPEEADLIVINTCGFIEPAKQESIAAVLDAADFKSDGSCRGLIVTGCLAERYRDELRTELAEADLIVGLADEGEIVSHCDRLLGVAPRKTIRAADDRHLLTPGHWGYLRISDGCDRACAFCAIPMIKGRNRSEPLKVLAEEAQRMVASGVREIALIAQDTMRYGTDLYGKPRLVDLLRALLPIDGLEWLRLLYTYPLGWGEDLIDLLASEEKLCAYVDMPIQHASDPVLKAMNRGTTREGIRSLIHRLRDRIPDLTLRSAVVVGFPGEREEHVRELIDFVEEIRFTRLVGFTYSHEEGTSAGALADDVPDSEKRARLDRIMSLQTAISSETGEACVGQTHRVLIDRPSDDPAFDFVGRTRMDAPEIDGEVFVTGVAKVGAFSSVEIVEATPFDLIGRVVDPAPLLGIEPASESGAVQ